LYARSGADLFFVLAAPREEEHYARLIGWTHTLRKISDRDWINVKKLNAYYLDEASRWEVKTVLYDQIEQIAALIEPIVDELPAEIASPDSLATPPRRPTGRDYRP
jgi:hypothetical protein